MYIEIMMMMMMRGMMTQNFNRTDNIKFIIRSL